MTDAEITKVQRRLTALKYDIGAVDGDFGPKTLSGLMALCAGRRISDELRAIAAPLAPQLIRHQIIGRYRLSHFLANACHETQGFTRLVESTSYSDAARLDDLFTNVNGLSDAKALVRAGAVAIGNRIYAGRNGNGDEASGDGYRFRGRGLMQHTGRGNYAALIKATGRELLTHPDQLSRTEIAAVAACAYWQDAGLNLIADKNDASGLRRVVNGKRRLGTNECKRMADRLIALWL